MYKKGDIITVRVTGIEDYGIFVMIDDTFTGLIHISEISDKFVRNINDYVGIDEQIYAYVISCDDVEKKVKLSIKNLDYKMDGRCNPDKLDGFRALREQLPKWVNDYKKENREWFFFQRLRLKAIIIILTNFQNKKGF